MEIAIALILGVIILIATIYVWKGKENAAIENGFAIKRDREFFKQKHTFKTQISNMSDICSKIDVSMLNDKKISVSQTQRGSLVFNNISIGGSFTASFRQNGISEEDGRYVYSFQVEKWSEKNGLSYNDLIGANIVLTTLEKIFIKLDPDTTITRTNATYKSKTDFI